MTNSTIRERLEAGTIEQHWIDYFFKYKGHTPLCCHEAQKKGEKGEWKVTCSWLKKWFPEKDVVLLCISGKDVELKKDEEGHLTIKADKIHIIKDKDAKDIKLIKGKPICIKKEKGKGDKNFFVIKSGELHLKKCIKGPMYYTIHFESGKEKKKKMYIKPHLDVLVAPHVEILPLLHMKSEQKKLKEKLKKLQEKLKRIRELKDKTEKAEAQEEALRDIEEALKEISKELEKEPKKHKDLKLGLKIDSKYDVADKIRYTLAKKIKLAKKIEDDLKYIYIEVKGDKKIISFIDKDECFQVIIKGKVDSESKGKCEEILRKLKESLPEGCKVDCKIDEEANTIIITITTDKKDDKSKKEVKKIVKEIVDELLKIEKKKSKDEKKVKYI